MSDLKPCPFCGGKASIKGDWNLEALSCDDLTGDCPGSWVSLPCHRPERRAASIAAWNARAAAPAAPAEVEAKPAEPAVAQWCYSGSCNWYDGYPDTEDGGGPYETRTLYAAPAAPAPVPLTEKQAEELWNIWAKNHRSKPIDLIKAIEAAIAASNGGGKP